MSKLIENLDDPWRRRTRLPEYDYATAGAYFITACTQDRMNLFGAIRDGAMHPNKFGEIVETSWHGLTEHYPNVSLDAFTVMPDHIHGIFLLRETASKKYGLSEIVRAFKAFSARRINAVRDTPGRPVWQRGFYEHIIRNEISLNEIRQYIETNPLRWELKRGGSAEVFPSERGRV